MNILSLNVNESITKEIEEFYQGEYPVSCYVSCECLLKDLLNFENDDAVVIIKLTGNDLSILRLIAEAKKEGAPIIILTEDYNLESRVRYLQMGASIVLKYPCNAVEIIYTADAISKENTSLTVRDRNFKVDYKMRTILFRDKQIKTTPQMFNLISYFVEHNQRVLSRPELIKVISGAEAKCSDRHVDSLMKLIREQTCSEIFKTVRGVGYMYNNMVE